MPLLQVIQEKNAHGLSFPYLDSPQKESKIVLFMTMDEKPLQWPMAFQKL